MNNNIESVYASFDTFPAPKGASVHIGEFAPALFSYIGSGMLLVLGDKTTPRWQIENNNTEIRRYISEEVNYLKKAIEFEKFIYNQVEAYQEKIKLAHFRDPWSGLPLIKALKNNRTRFVYEVNALPSIEIPSRLSSVLSTTIEKIRKTELFCLNKADKILCPSNVIKNYLTSLEINEDKIIVIQNGARLSDIPHKKPYTAPENYIIYIGTVQQWQGVETLLKAMTFLEDMSDLKLVFCVSGARPRIKFLQKLCDRLKLSDRVIWNIRVGQNEIKDWLEGALLSVAPLTECERNLIQGCCPIKIVESMAAGVPVIASNMPVTQELLEHNKTGWLIRPDRPSELARAIRVLIYHPEVRERISTTAKEKVLTDLTWEHSLKRLIDVYKSL